MHLFLALISLGFIASPPAMVDQIKPLPYTEANAPVIIEAYAVRYGIPSGALVNTIRCESGFNAKAVGDQGQSFGMAQIHLPSHPDITREQALDPFFAIDWTAQQFKEGNANLWTCYRNLYGSKKFTDLAIVF